jgi:hypothetical protein
MRQTRPRRLWWPTKPPEARSPGSRPAGSSVRIATEGNTAGFLVIRISPRQDASWSCVIQVSLKRDASWSQVIQVSLKRDASWSQVIQVSLKRDASWSQVIQVSLKRDASWSQVIQVSLKRDASWSRVIRISLARDAVGSRKKKRVGGYCARASGIAWPMLATTLESPPARASRCREARRLPRPLPGNIQRQHGAHCDVA